MGDCRGLIEFCRAFEQHQNSYNRTQAQSRNKRSKPLSPLSHPSCEHSTVAAMDVLILILVIGTLGFLTFPYIKLILCEAFALLPAALNLMGSANYRASLAYAVGFLLLLLMVVILWEFMSQQLRKCDNPYCRGLRRSVAVDIQLESEECVKCMPPLPVGTFGAQPFELEENRKELEAELKKMAPMNGRTVLILRARCGCPVGRMEVWGPKRVRRIKK